MKLGDCAMAAALAPSVAQNRISRAPKDLLERSLGWERSSRSFGARQCVTFQSGGQTCFGMLHTPAAAQVGKRPGVLIMHGLVGSKDQPHRIFVTLAEALSRVGYVSLRFDLRGRGDSEGDSIDITPQRDLADAEAGLATLRQHKDVDATNL